ncbi:MAG: FAA hydrolase family protein [Candidatus Abyssobacteria bacterium SURF_5]|uniref:FAA hydrolase family protein n=1 Tax=Abyssobacteria bacterium (strain SURF_5) TaxID=2093360 RepID=A0A3A4P6E5_ABYX5|nr:MAG: FAA hydrolase family protein [Candidatus Abyssubacteria bacterium SURF_5]
MKICRYRLKNKVEFGIVEDSEIIVLAGDPLKKIEKKNVKRALAEVALLPPTQPSKVVAVGLNYQEHIDETGMEKPEAPILFIKPSTAVIAHNEPILYPKTATRVDYEAELGVVIGKKCKHVSVGEAASVIFGYTCLNDVTERFMQMKDGQWTRAKSFDTFCPIGPWMETDMEPSGLRVEAYLNGERKQSATTEMFIFKIDELISFISGVMTLLPGDVIATGTPSGIGPMEPGDSIEIRVENIGSLINPVRKEAD